MGHGAERILYEEYNGWLGLNAQLLGILHPDKSVSYTLSVSGNGHTDSETQRYFRMDDRFTPTIIFHSLFTTMALRWGTKFTQKDLLGEAIS